MIEGPAIAIIGMAGRFPGAANVRAFWENILAGTDSISHFSRAELESRDRATKEYGPDYVGARGILDDVDLFDPEFFGLSPREAELLDPQHRLFLETCWNTLESAGYDPAKYSGLIGVFGGCSLNTYLLSNLCSSREVIDEITGNYQVGEFQSTLGNDKDFLVSRVAYKLNLRGPCVVVQGACATSLVAICQASQSLLNWQCDMALAGGVSITFPQRRGHIYQEGGMGSRDGSCRPFDAEASGTVFSHGVGAVLLKRLEDAIADRDDISAVIRGFAVNNDGSVKVGFMAPGVEGQASVIAAAQAMAEVSPDSISYIEAHGTATPLGDPIEIAALTKAFRTGSSRNGFCAIGTAKANVGHLDVAAGVAGVIKTALSLRNRVIPPLAHFQHPNPRIDFATTPFYINQELVSWEASEPRRAGVSGFGVGGVNAHIVLEEAPLPEASPTRRTAHLLCVSGRSDRALDLGIRNLGEHFSAFPETNLADTAYTLHTGRRAFDRRAFMVCSSSSDVERCSDNRKPGSMERGTSILRRPRCVFLFPGQGSQFRGMGSVLYETEEVYRRQVDECAEILLPLLETDIRRVLLAPRGNTAARPTGELDAADIQDTRLSQPALFVTEIALAYLWMDWGIRPTAVAGHSLGEFVAAVLAGVMSREDGLRLVAIRARLMQSLPRGAMLSVRLGERELTPMLNEPVSLAAANGPMFSVVAGPFAAIDELKRRLDEENIACTRLRTSHAFHSAMVEPMLEQFAAEVREVELREPSIPLMSCVTGTWMQPGQSTNPAYWAEHCRRTVRFGNALSMLTEIPEAVLLEVGPGNALSTLAASASEIPAIASLPDRPGHLAGAGTIFEALGRLWLTGIEPDWARFYAHESRRRVALPVYPFDRKRCWVEVIKKEESWGEPVRKTVTAQGFNAVAEPSKLTTDPTTGVTDPMPDSTQTLVPDDRMPRLQNAIAALFEELSGIAAPTDAFELPFAELGFDSLFLTQASQAVKRKFGVKVTFRQMLEQCSSIAALANHLDSVLPADAFRQQRSPVAIAAAAPVSLPAAAPVSIAAAGSLSLPPQDGTSGSALEQLFRDQMQTMSRVFEQQLSALRGAASTSVVPVPVPNGIAAGSTPAVSEASTLAQTPETGAGYSTFTPFKPLQTTGGALTEQQQDYIDGFIRKYQQRTATSKQMIQASRSVLADPRVVSGFRPQWKEIVYPIVANRSKGSRLWDVDGNEYIDILNGFGAILFGHSPDWVSNAVRIQIDAGVEIGPMTPLAGEVAQMLCEMTGNERATFCNTGSEAVMGAMRLARTVTGRDKVVYFSGDYHGSFDEVLVHATARGASPIAPGIPSANTSNIIVLEYGSERSLNYIRQHADEIAAVLVEPIQSRNPALRPHEFLHSVRRITEEGEIALIFDEVVTGFRVSPGGAQEYYGIRADMVTYGKVIGGGYPIGVLAGKKAYLDALDGGEWQYGDDSFPPTGVTFFAATFVRHPLALAASRAVLRHLKEAGPALQSSLNGRVGELVQGINQDFDEAGVSASLNHFASWFYFTFPAEIRHASLLYHHLRLKGIHIQEGFPCFLTTEHTAEDFARIRIAFRESVSEMQAGGLFPVRESDQAIAATGAGAAQSSVTGMHPKALEANLAEAPLTESQKEIWLAAHQGDEANCAFNESVTVKLSGTVRESEVVAALQAILDRHDALRSTVQSDGELMRIAPAFRREIPIVDLSSLPDVEREGEIARRIKEEGITPFDLAVGPLVRATVLRSTPAELLVIFTGHHIVMDGWSASQFFEDVGKFYTAQQTGKQPDFEPLMPFSSYAMREAASLKAGEFAENEKYWVDLFTNRSPVLDLPTDRPRPALKGYQGATIRRKLGRRLYEDLKKSSGRNGCTLYVTLLSAFQILLHRLSRQPEVVIGIPTAGQSLLENADLVGHCVHFLPMLSDLADGASVREHLAATRGRLLDAYDHQEFTYGTLLRRLPIRRDPSRLPLIEVQFNLERIGPNIRFEGLRVEMDANPKQFVNTDLFFNAIETENDLILDCDYNTALLDEGTVERWLTCYSNILEGIAADPGQRVDKLEIVDPQEREQLLVKWNRTQTDFGPFEPVQSLIEQRAAETPGAIAAVCGGVRWSYKHLNEFGNRLGRNLRRHGVTNGSRVAICMERSLEMLGAVLGVLKAGGAYVPLDPRHPEERLKHVLDDAEVSLLLTEQHLAGRLSTNARVICLDAEKAILDRESAAPLENETQADSLAYVLYTSGSTGKPKGVAIEHGSLFNLLRSVQREPGLSRADVMVSVATLAFDIATAELLLPLVTGARVVIATTDQVFDGKQLRSLLENEHATVFQATPATWRMLLEAGWHGMPGLTKLFSTGEALPRELAERLLKCGGELWNLYGPTETTIWSAITRVESSPGLVPIGGPIANTQLRVLDANRQLVPIGVPGELHISGQGLARGYLGNPELTGQKFVSDPFATRSGARMYRTGDLVRYRPDGTLEFLGRLDHQIKLRGFRIELGEIEAALMEHRAVNEAVALAREDQSGEKRLIAWYTANSEQVTPSALELRSFLETKLPDYMIPVAIIAVPSIPRTPNGKIDTRALPTPRRDAMARSEVIKPRTPKEKALAQIWTHVLGLDEVSVDSSIFELGGDSLLIFRITVLAGQAGFRFTPRDVFQHRTIAALSGLGEEPGSNRSAGHVIVPVSRDAHRKSRASLKS
jgi:amino acid adenylation domain-containing protein